MLRLHLLMNALTLCLVLTTAAAARAESRVDITPSLAYLNPTTNAVDQEDLVAKFAGAAGYGGRLSFWLNESVMLETSAHYGRTSLDGTAFGDVGSLDLALFYGSVQIAVALGAEQRLMLHGGLGLQGTNYDELIEGGNIMTGVFGLSGVMPLGETTMLRADFDMHVHTTFFELGDLRTEELTQYDAVLAVGIQFRSGGR